MLGKKVKPRIVFFIFLLMIATVLVFIIIKSLEEIDYDGRISLNLFTSGRRLGFSILFSFPSLSTTL